MNQLEFKIPTLKEALGMIQQLDSIDWESFDGIDLEKYIKKTSLILSDIILNRASTILKANENIFKGKFVYRVRKLNDIKNKQLRSEFSYPPVHFAKENLRANLIGNPVFYSSDHPLTALLEYIQQWDIDSHFKNEDLFISCWTVTPPNDYYIAPFVSSNINSPLIKLRDFTKEEYMKAFGVNLSVDNIQAIKALDDYFCSLFLGNKTRANISAFLAHQFLYLSDNNCILFYPSIKTKYSKLNYAFHPNFADEYLYLSHIYHVSIMSIIGNKTGDLKFDYTLYDDIGIVQNSIIKWYSVDSNKEEFSKYFILDFRQEPDFSRPKSTL